MYVQKLPHTRNIFEILTAVIKTLSVVWHVTNICQPTRRNIPEDKRRISELSQNVKLCIPRYEKRRLLESLIIANFEVRLAPGSEMIGHPFATDLSTGYVKILDGISPSFLVVKDQCGNIEFLYYIYICIRCVYVCIYVNVSCICVNAYNVTRACVISSPLPLQLLLQSGGEW
jgi:hypothetical protein